MPPGFQGDPEIAQSVGSGLDSVASGIQSTAKTALPAEVSDWLDAFTADFSQIGSESAARFAEPGAVSSPDVYWENARQAGDLNAFSDLVPMDGVANKLADSSFDHQTALQNFADVLKDVEVGQYDPPSLPHYQETPGATEAEGHEKWIELQHVTMATSPGVTEAEGHEKWIELDFATLGATEGIGHEKWIELNHWPQSGDAVNDNTSQGIFVLRTITDSEIMQRFENLRGSIQEILKTTMTILREDILSRKF